MQINNRTDSMLVIVSEVSANQFPILPIKSSKRFQMDLRYVIYERVLWLIGIGPRPRGVRISPCFHIYTDATWQFYHLSHNKSY